MESPNRRLQVNALSGVAIESIAGDISASSLEDIKLESLDGGASNLVAVNLQLVYIFCFQCGFIDKLK